MTLTEEDRQDNRPGSFSGPPCWCIANGWGPEGCGICNETGRQWTVAPSLMEKEDVSRAGRRSDDDSDNGGGSVRVRADLRSNADWLTMEKEDGNGQFYGGSDRGVGDDASICSEGEIRRMKEALKTISKHGHLVGSVLAGIATKGLGEDTPTTTTEKEDGAMGLSSHDGNDAGDSGGTMDKSISAVTPSPDIAGLVERLRARRADLYSMACADFNEPNPLTGLAFDKDGSRIIEGCIALDEAADALERIKQLQFQTQNRLTLLAEANTELRAEIKDHVGENAKQHAAIVELNSTVTSLRAENERLKNEGMSRKERLPLDSDI